MHPTPADFLDLQEGFNRDAIAKMALMRLNKLFAKAAAKKEGAKLNWFSKLWGNDKALEADIIALGCFPHRWHHFRRRPS